MERVDESAFKVTRRKYYMKLFSILSSTLVFTAGLINFISDHDHHYLYHLTCVYLMVVSAAIIVLEAMPERIIHYAQKNFPFIGQYSGRGALFIILGTFCFGLEGAYSDIAGAIVLLCGILALAFHYFGMAPDSSEALTELNDESQATQM
mmetsp:Transcript_7064/g.7774  ORF Transcript_7064/g.7774 Transcript_7064/m.7774 type:complete len:150 (+) Transcript_7064:38-487(+)